MHPLRAGCDAGATAVRHRTADAGAAEAAARRKARKAARAHAPAPERNPAYADLDLHELRELRAGLGAEETKISYWRRIIQARLDVIRAQGGAPTGSPAWPRSWPMPRSRTTGWPTSTRCRWTTCPPLPDLAELWARVADPDDPEGTAALVDSLTAAEREISAFRRELHRRIDAVTSELVARYRDNPLLALTVLPQRPQRLMQF